MTDSTTSTPAQNNPTWVVGIDGSDHATHALEWAAQMAAGREVAIDAIAAWEFSFFGQVPLPGGAIPATSIETQDEIVAGIYDVAKQVSADYGVEVSARALAGSAAEVLLENVGDAELIVVGSRGHGGFARLVLGSVSHQLASHSARPTIIVPDGPDPGGLDRVVIGFDGSPNSIAATRWAHDFAPLDAELVVVQSWEIPPMGFDGLGPEALGTLSETAESQFNDAVGDLERELADPGRFVRVFDRGHPGHRLVEEGEQADLLVVGARGRSGLLGTVLGSVSTWVVHHLPCPGAVVPDPASSDT